LTDVSETEPKQRVNNIWKVEVNLSRVTFISLVWRGGTVYPISVGFEAALERINLLIENGHHAEAL
jgi:hypothetical protein